MASLKRVELLVLDNIGFIMLNRKAFELLFQNVYTTIMLSTSRNTIAICTINEASDVTYATKEPNNLTYHLLYLQVLLS